MYRFICSKRYVNLLFQIKKDKNIHQLSKEPNINMTVSHLSNVTAQFVREGLITKTKDGREAKLELTSKGEELITLLVKFDELARKRDLIKNVEKGEEWKKKQTQKLDTTKEKKN